MQSVADLRAAFVAMGITIEMLERKRSRKIDDFTPEDVAALRVVYGSIKREEVSVAEEFPPLETEKRPEGSKLDALEASTAAPATKRTQGKAAETQPIENDPTLSVAAE